MKRRAVEPIRCISRSMGKMTGPGECLFCRDLYGPDNVVAESEMLVSSKLREVEREIDKLPAQLREAYFLAVAEEIKQRTNYVRSKRFLLVFLRADNFDAPKAAMRLAKFFKLKLDLFGPERLPRHIVQDDLSNDDRKVMESGFIQYGAVDCGGRMTIFSRLEQLRSMDLARPEYVDNFLRAGFYLIMSAVENNEESQKKGFVLVRWNFNSTLPLNAYRLLFLSVIRTAAYAVPWKCAGVHSCYNTVIERIKFTWMRTILPRNVKQVMKNHDTSPTGCLAALAECGIDVGTLPITPSGQFKIEVHRAVLKQARRREISEMQIRMQCGNINSYVPIVPVPLLNNEQPMGRMTRPALLPVTGILEKDEHLSKLSAEEQLPAKLMEILQRNRNPDAIWWLPDSNAFAIEKDKFPLFVLSSDFNGIKFDSFLRRLRRWGFRRLPDRKGESLNYIAYQHPLFQKDSPELLKDWDLYDEELPKRDKLPVKLMKVLDSNKAPEAIWWESDGKAIAIETEKFPDAVLEKDFEGLKLSSFFRMLRRWGFKRISDQGKGVVIYQHSLFQKDSPLFKTKSADPLANWSCLDALAQLATPEEDRQKEETFPMKLYKIMGNQESQEAIWWSDSGDSFNIQTNKFQNIVLEKEFNGIKYTSFLRTLKRWGFKKLQAKGSPPNVSIYQHPSFKKDSPQLINSWTKAIKPKEVDNKKATSLKKQKPKSKIATVSKLKAPQSPPTTNFIKGHDNVNLDDTLRTEKVEQTLNSTVVSNLQQQKEKNHNSSYQITSNQNADYFMQQAAQNLHQRQQLYNNNNNYQDGGGNRNISANNLPATQVSNLIQNDMLQYALLAQQQAMLSRTALALDLQMAQRKRAQLHHQLLSAHSKGAAVGNGVSPALTLQTSQSAAELETLTSLGNEASTSVDLHNAPGVTINPAIFAAGQTQHDRSCEHPLFR